MGKKPRPRAAKSVAGSRYVDFDTWRSAVIQRYGPPDKYTGDTFLDMDQFFRGTVADAGSSAYDPDADAGLVFWFKADDTTDGPRKSGDLVPGNNEAVATWRDSHTNNVDVTGAAIYHTNSLNSLPGVGFVPGSSHVLVSAELSVALDSPTVSAFMLYTNRTGGQALGRFTEVIGDGQTAGHTNAKSFTFFQDGSTNETVNVYGNTDYIPVGGAGISSPFGTPKTLGVIFDGANARNYISGSASGTRAWTTNIGDNILRYLSLGASHGSGNDKANFILYEFFLTTTDLTSDVTAVMDYFDAKWGTH